MHCTCAPAGREKDMLLMRGHWQLAEIFKSISSLPTLLKVFLCSICLPCSCKARILPKKAVDIPASPLDFAVPP